MIVGDISLQLNLDGWCKKLKCPLLWFKTHYLSLRRHYSQREINNGLTAFIWKIVDICQKAQQFYLCLVRDFPDRNLFPCGDSMVCIIDDREDVWKFAPNLITVKKYIYFQGTGDINAPPGSREAQMAKKGTVPTRLWEHDALVERPCKLLTVYATLRVKWTTKNALSRE